MRKFLLISEFKWTDIKEFDLNKYTSNSLKDCVLEVDLEFPKELCKLPNCYPLATDKLKSREKCRLIIN